MPQYITKLIFVLLTSCLLYMQSAYAVKIVRLELEYGSDDVVATGGFDIPKTNRVLDLELHDNAAPITVANFLNYVNSGRYDLTFFNRSVTDFVLQAGGVNNISADPDNEPLSTSFGEVEKYPSILNEPSMSNSRGTIAMEKIPGQPDSASSEWFINLNDNSDSLDTDNGGFAVFGSVVDNGMETADEIAAFPVINLSFFFGSSYSELPLADVDQDAETETTFTQKNIVMILRAAEINRPILRFSPADGNFGTDIFGNGASKSIALILKNTGNETLILGTISDSVIQAPFSILSENCSNTTLEPVSVKPASSCTVNLQFLATASGVFSDSLSIDYTGKENGDNFSVKYNISGEGAAIGAPEIATEKTVDVGTSQVAGFVMSKEIIVNNIGQSPLQILEITGSSNTDFGQINNCDGGDVLIPPGGFCTIIVSLTTNDFGEHVATLTIESNDPINNILNIKLTGFGDSDSDGVQSAIEDAASNAGDGNFDGNIDSQQNYIASFVDQAGEYISLVVDESYVVTNISVTSEDTANPLPSNVTFKHGILEFEVIVDVPGRPIEIGLILPSGDVPIQYYLFGETEDNETPHWYPYPGAQTFSNIKFSSSVKSLIKLQVQDGGVGDADHKVNGRIFIGPGIISYSKNGNSGGGSINIIFMGFYLFLLALMSRRYRLFNL